MEQTHKTHTSYEVKEQNKIIKKPKMNFIGIG